MNKTNNYWFNMTSSYFSQNSAYAFVWRVFPDGSMENYANVNSSGGIRPVINLNYNVLISSGDGTIDNPFQIS